jgi:SNF2 family DNA or RNA helicase
MSGPKRESVLKECNESESFILFLTYKIGSTGMNLQCADTVIILDLDWLESNVSQAIARVARQGQDQEVNIYILISNTGIENAIFKKQINKAEMISQLQTGAVTTARDRFKVTDIIVMLEQDVISEKAKTIYIK